MRKFLKEWGTLIASLSLVFAIMTPWTLRLINIKHKREAKCNKLKREIQKNPAIVKKVSWYNNKYCLKAIHKIKAWIKVGKKYLRKKQTELAENAFSRAKIIAAKANINIAHLLLTSQ